MLNRKIEKCVPVVVTFVSLASWIKFSRPKLLKAFVKLSGCPVVPAKFVGELE